MLKPDSLRAALTASILAADGARLLKRDPDKLAIYIDRGRLVAHLGPTRGYEWRYRLTGTLIGFSGSPDAIALPLLEWIRTNQPDLLLNHETARNAVTFEIDVIDAQTVDVEFALELTETVNVTPRAGGGYDMVHLGEPPIEPADPMFGDTPAPLGEVWLGGERILGPA